MTSPTHKSEHFAEPILIKVTEAAKILSICRASVHALIDGGELVARKVTAKRRAKRVHVRITRDSLTKFYRDRFGKDLDCVPTSSSNK